MVDLVIKVHRFHQNLFDICKFLLLIFIIIYGLFKASANMGYDWQWYRIPEYIYFFEDGKFHPGLLLTGLGITLKITVVGTIIATVAGLTSALLALSSSFAGRMLSRFYLESIRNTPLLIQLFIIYFVIAPVLEMSQFTSAVFALGLFEGAYVSEIFRAGILSVNEGQWEASKALGMKKSQAYRYIILPQAIKVVLPPLTSQGISLVKDSALVSTIAIYDLTLQGQAIVSETFLTFEIWFTVAVIYLIITLFLQVIVKIMKQKLVGSY